MLTLIFTSVHYRFQSSFGFHNAPIHSAEKQPVAPGNLSYREVKQVPISDQIPVYEIKLQHCTFNHSRVGYVATTNLRPFLVAILPPLHG